MNAARVAALLRELADAIEDEGHVARPAKAASRPRRPRALTRPPGEATPLIAAQAALVLKNKGFT